MICSKCGSQNAEGNIFCEVCGQPFVGASQGQGQHFEPEPVQSVPQNDYPDYPQAYYGDSYQAYPQYQTQDVPPGYDPGYPQEYPQGCGQDMYYRQDGCAAPKKPRITAGMYALMLVNAGFLLVNLALLFLPLLDLGYMKVNLIQLITEGFKNNSPGVSIPLIAAFGVVSVMALITLILAICRKKSSGGVGLAAAIFMQDYSLALSVTALVTQINTHSSGSFLITVYFMFAASVVSIVLSALVLAKTRKK